MQTNQLHTVVLAPDGCTLYRPVAANPTPEDMADWCYPKPAHPFDWRTHNSGAVEI